MSVDDQHFCAGEKVEHKEEKERDSLNGHNGKELQPGLPRGWPIAFPGATAGSWIGSGAARIRTGTLTLDAGFTTSGLTCCATMFGPP